MRNWFAVCPPGLEPAIAQELSALGHAGSVEAGGVRFTAALEAGCDVCVAARTPGRLLLELANGPARSTEQLLGLVRKVDWSCHLTARAEIDVTVSSKRSRLRFRETISKKVHSTLIRARSGTQRDAGEPQRVYIRLQNDHATVSLDTGGERLHRRGWRQATGRAPIRENLAAAMLVMAGWRGDEPLVDPFCGVGTIPIEAARMAAGRPPGIHRSYAFQSWPIFGRTRRQPPAERVWDPQLPIVGADKDAGSRACAVDNAARARVRLRWVTSDVAQLEPPADAGLVIANPPYGQRLGQQVEGVYRAFGQTLRERFGGWRALFLAPNAALASRVHATASRLTTFSNGGIRVGVYVVEQF